MPFSISRSPALAVSETGFRKAEVEPRDMVAAGAAKALFAKTDGLAHSSSLRYWAWPKKVKIPIRKRRAVHRVRVGLRSLLKIGEGGLIVGPQTALVCPASIWPALW